MKNCIVCGKEVVENEDVCTNCLEFLKWKHEEDFIERIEEFRKLQKQKRRFDSIKCFRRKK